MLFLLTLSKIPIAKKVIQMEVPPVLTNGSGCPVTGINWTATAIFVKAWKTTGIPTAIDTNCPNFVCDL